LRVQLSGFRVQGSGFRVQGSGFRVQGSGFRGNSCLQERFEFELDPFGSHALFLECLLLRLGRAERESSLLTTYWSESTLSS